MLFLLQWGCFHSFPLKHGRKITERPFKSLKESIIQRVLESLTTLAWAPGDYENWEGTLIKLGGHNINRGGGGPMAKIKDFTLASQNLGARAPRALHTRRP